MTESELPYASCHSCKYLATNSNRFECHVRSEMAMLEDKSPCLIWDDGKDD